MLMYKLDCVNFTFTSPICYFCIHAKHFRQKKMLQPSEFHDYACAKAYDILSKGKYKKFLIQSRSAGEEWACKSVLSVQVIYFFHLKEQCWDMC
jgi:hypothetical protein